MINHSTKYNVGDMVYWLQKSDGIYEIKKDSIRSIKIGGKANETYEISYTSRSEKDVFDNFESAKKLAIELQKIQNDRATEIVESYEDIKI